MFPLSVYKLETTIGLCTVSKRAAWISGLLDRHGTGGVVVANRHGAGGVVTANLTAGLR